MRREVKQLPKFKERDGRGFTLRPERMPDIQTSSRSTSSYWVEFTDSEICSLIGYGLALSVKYQVLGDFIPFCTRKLQYSFADLPKKASGSDAIMVNHIVLANPTKGLLEARL